MILMSPRRLAWLAHYLVVQPHLTGHWCVVWSQSPHLCQKCLPSHEVGTVFPSMSPHHILSSQISGNPTPPEWARYYPHRQQLCTEAPPLQMPKLRTGGKIGPDSAVGRHPRWSELLSFSVQTAFTLNGKSSPLQARLPTGLTDLEGAHLFTQV